MLGEHRDRVSLVPLRQGGSRYPLFFASTPMKLARYLPPDQPLYDVNIPTVCGGVRAHAAPARHSRDLLGPTVEQCVAAIRSAQPRGPYHLGGHCFGGLPHGRDRPSALGDGRRGGTASLLVDPDPEDEVPIAVRIVHHLRELGGLGALEKASLLRKKTGSLVSTLKRLVVGKSQEEADYATLYSEQWGSGAWKHPFPTAILLSRPKYPGPRGQRAARPVVGEAGRAGVHALRPPGRPHHLVHRAPRGDRSRKADALPRPRAGDARSQGMDEPAGSDILPEPEARGSRWMAAGT